MRYPTLGYIRCRRDEREQVARKQVSFDLRDAKGRIIGYRVSIDRELWVADDASFTSWSPKYVGRPTWRVMPHATRDGADYGPTLAGDIALTEDGALKAADAMIEAYRKKMAKKFA
jgi:hypothetical protein